MKLAVIGHSEWVEFACVDRLPERGEIVEATESFELPAGGAAVAAMQIMRLAGKCLFFTAVGRDRPGDRVISGLAERGLRVEAARRDVPQRRAFVHLDSGHERTITTIGPRAFPEVTDPLPWAELDDCDAVYLTAGSADTLRATRSARMVVATVRAGEALAEAGVQVDVLVASANDPGERIDPAIDPAPRWTVRTDGSRGGSVEAAGGPVSRWRAVPPCGPTVDTYGAGDSFAGGLTFGLGSGLPIEKAVGIGALCGASVLRGRGPYEAQANATELQAWEETGRLGSLTGRSERGSGQRGQR